VFARCLIRFSSPWKWAAIRDCQRLVRGCSITMTPARSKNREKFKNASPLFLPSQQPARLHFFRSSFDYEARFFRQLIGFRECQLSKRLLRFGQ